MPLFVAELDSSNSNDIDVTLAQIDSAASHIGAEFIESQITANHARIFAVLEANDIVSLRAALSSLEVGLDDLAQVRLVGAELEDVKKLRNSVGYLVEWDFPEGLTMDRYLTRKAEKSPLYKDIQDVKFLRTYVREDMVKCLCFYDGESEAAVLAAREVVDTPVSRLHKLES